MTVEHCGNLCARWEEALDVVQNGIPQGLGDGQQLPAGDGPIQAEPDHLW
jgi:hypothetical protein